MNTGWENHEPAPIEFLHNRFLELFHKFRLEKTQDSTVSVNGIDLNRIIAQAKTETYAKYPKQNLQNAILKSEM